jgi:hypothetical protein
LYSPQSGRWFVASYGGCNSGESGLSHVPRLNHLGLCLLFGVSAAWLLGVLLHSHFFKKRRVGEYREIPGGEVDDDDDDDDDDDETSPSAIGVKTKDIIDGKMPPSASKVKGLLKPSLSPVMEKGTA